MLSIFAIKKCNILLRNVAFFIYTYSYAKGEELYFDKSQRADNEITAKEAYELAKEELLAANQIGDTKGTAKVEFGTAAGGKTEADYKAGDSVTIGGTAYTIGETAENAVTAINDAVDAAVTAATTPVNTTGATALTLVGSVSDGANTINIFKPGNAFAGGSVIYSTAATMNHTQAATTAAGVGADKTAADVEALMAAGATAEFTPAGGNAVSVTVADDSDGSTVISAVKAAELENAAGGGDAGEASNVYNITTASAEAAKTLSFNLHAGADADMTNKIQVDIETMNSSYLGIKNLNLSDPSGIGAAYAIDAIQDAISKVSAQRSTPGAIQNRLEHTIANLDNVVENTTSAESRIRDTDMASEMVEYSKNNILAPGRPGNAGTGKPVHTGRAFPAWITDQKINRQRFADFCRALPVYLKSVFKMPEPVLDNWIAFDAKLPYNEHNRTVERICTLTG